MTSAEKIAELRVALATAATARDADPTLPILFGAWRFIPKLIRRRLLEVLPDLENADELDALLGLIAGAALELHSDAPDGAGADVDEVAELRGVARGLFDAVLER